MSPRHPGRPAALAAGAAVAAVAAVGAVRRLRRARGAPEPRPSHIELPDGLPGEVREAIGEGLVAGAPAGGPAPQWIPVPAAAASLAGTTPVVASA